MTRMIQEANERGCHRLVVQSALENRLERRLAAEQGWAITEVDPLGSGNESYQQYLKTLYTAITSY